MRENAAIVDGKTRGMFPVRACDSNQLASNNPNEDRRIVGRLLSDNSSLFCVLDGHGGPECAQTVSERLFDYIAVSLMSESELEDYYNSLRDGPPQQLVQYYTFSNAYEEISMRQIYRHSLQNFVLGSLSTWVDLCDLTPSQRIDRAIRQLDCDILSEAITTPNPTNLYAIRSAISGCVGTVVYVKDVDMVIANFGDCRVICGKYDVDGSWKLEELTTDHDVHCQSEVERVRSEHPMNEHQDLFAYDRLMGVLLPLRAMGDGQLKWPLSDIKKIEHVINKQITPYAYRTPPYLTSNPEMTNVTLTSRDRFVVLASDGLWGTLKSEEVVQIVGEHMETIETPSRAFFDPTVALGPMNRVLKKRRMILANKQKSIDPNTATHLIRKSLPDEHVKASQALTYPQHVVRHIRDDITVIVVHFDDAFISNFLGDDSIVMGD